MPSPVAFARAWRWRERLLRRRGGLLRALHNRRRIREWLCGRLAS